MKKDLNMAGESKALPGLPESSPTIDADRRLKPESQNFESTTGFPVFCNLLPAAFTMGKKANKASRKYAATGKLKNEIQSRKKHQQIKRNIERRKAGKSGKKGLDAEEREYLEDGPSVKKNGAARASGGDESENTEEGASDAETGK